MAIDTPTERQDEVPQWGGFTARQLFEDVFPGEWDEWREAIRDPRGPDHARAREQANAVVGLVTTFVTDEFIAAAGHPGDITRRCEWVMSAKFRFLTRWDLERSTLAEDRDGGGLYVGVRFFAPIPYEDRFGHHFDHVGLQRRGPRTKLEKLAAECSPLILACALLGKVTEVLDAQAEPDPTLTLPLLATPEMPTVSALRSLPPPSSSASVPLEHAAEALRAQFGSGALKPRSQQLVMMSAITGHRAQLEIMSRKEQLAFVQAMTRGSESTFKRAVRALKLRSREESEGRS